MKPEPTVSRIEKLLTIYPFPFPFFNFSFGVAFIHYSIYGHGWAGDTVFFISFHSFPFPFFFIMEGVIYIIVFLFFPPPSPVLSSSLREGGTEVDMVGKAERERCMLIRIFF